MTKTGIVFPITIFGSQERKGIELITEVRLRVSDWSQDWEDRHWNQPKRRRRKSGPQSQEVRDSGKGSQEEAEPEAGRAERWGRSSAGREVGWACLASPDRTG